MLPERVQDVDGERDEPHERHLPAQPEGEGERNDEQREVLRHEVDAVRYGCLDERRAGGEAAGDGSAAVDGVVVPCHLVAQEGWGGGGGREGVVGQRRRGGRGRGTGRE